MLTAPPGKVPLQLYLPIFPPLEIEAWLEVDRLKNIQYFKRKAADQARARKLIAIEAVSDSTMDLPFGSGGEEPCHIEVSEALADEFLIAGEDPDEPFDWSESAIEALHAELFIKNLELLNTSGNGAEKRNILEWIFAPPVFEFAKAGKPTKAKVWKTISSDHMPFGFDWCCRFAGYNPEAVREGLAPILKKMGMQELFKEIQNDSELNSATDNNKSGATGLPDTYNVRKLIGIGKRPLKGVSAGLAGGTNGRSTLCV